VEKIELSLLMKYLARRKYKTTKSFAQAIRELKEEFPDMRLDYPSKRFFCEGKMIGDYCDSADHDLSKRIFERFREKLVECGVPPMDHLGDLVWFAGSYCDIINLDWKKKHLPSDQWVPPDVQDAEDEHGCEMAKKCDPILWIFTRWQKFLKRQKSRQEAEKVSKTPVTG
jgi:hypothetical protein